jgi:hypothetical protein
MTPREEVQILSINRLDQELITRSSQGNIDLFFDFPNMLSKDHEGLESMMGVKEFYIHAASRQPDPRLARFSTQDLIKLLRKKARDLNQTRGIRFHDHRMDFYSISDHQVKRCANAVAAILTGNQLIKQDQYRLKIKAYTFGKIFGLCEAETFYNQPIAPGRVSTGFLVGGDVIATAAHCLGQAKLGDYRFVFGYRFGNPTEPPLVIPEENIYKGIRVIKEYDKNANETDWALIKLDRKVKGVTPLELSSENITRTRPVYIIGYPVGLPLKYAPGACIREVFPDSFVSDLDVFSGNSGSPVIDHETHQVIGFVKKSDIRDFRRDGNCWVTMIFPKYEIYARGAYCINISIIIKNLSRISQQ